MLEIRWQAAIDFALKRLENELDPRLTYHSLAHTRDHVLPAAKRLGRLAGLSAENHLILTTAAAYHDIGFLIQRQGHEELHLHVVRIGYPDLVRRQPSDRQSVRQPRMDHGRPSSCGHIEQGQLPIGLRCRIRPLLAWLQPAAHRLLGLSRWRQA